LPLAEIYARVNFASDDDDRPVTRRILLLNTDLEQGGTPTVIRELATRLARATDAHIEVACLSKWGPVADPISAAGIAVTATQCGRCF